MTIVHKIEHVYEYPWEVIVEHYSQKFQESSLPNPQLPDLVNVTYPQFQYDENLSLVRYRRIVTLATKIPNWMKKLGALDRMDYESTVELSRGLRHMKCVTVNTQFLDKLQVQEVGVYQPHPENPKWTLLSMTASLSLVYIPGLSSAVENFILKTYFDEVAKTRELEKPYVIKVAENPLPEISDMERRAMECIGSIGEFKTNLKSVSMFSYWSGKNADGHRCFIIRLKNFSVDEDLNTAREHLLDTLCSGFDFGRKLAKMAIVLDFVDVILSVQLLDFIRNVIPDIKDTIQDHMTDLYFYSIDAQFQSTWACLVETNMQKILSNKHVHLIQENESHNHLFSGTEPPMLQTVVTNEPQSTKKASLSNKILCQQVKRIVNRI